jgi:uncharacterized membrane protein
MGNEPVFYFHPIAVHFPIAFYFLELVFLVFWQWKRDEQYLRFAKFVFRAAYFFMILAMITGLRDTGGFQNITGEVKTHFLTALGAAAVATLRLFVWQFSKERLNPGLLIAASILLNFLIAVTGFWGGKLVYE